MNRKKICGMDRDAHDLPWKSNTGDGKKRKNPQSFESSKPELSNFRSNGELDKSCSSEETSYACCSPKGYSLWWLLLLLSLMHSFYREEPAQSAVLPRSCTFHEQHILHIVPHPYFIRPYRSHIRTFLVMPHLSLYAVSSFSAPKTFLQKWINLRTDLLINLWVKRFPDYFLIIKTCYVGNVERTPISPSEVVGDLVYTHIDKLKWNSLDWRGARHEDDLT